MITVYCAVEATPADREFVAVTHVGAIVITHFGPTADAARRKAEAFYQAAVVEKKTGPELKARIAELEGCEK